VAGTSRRQKTRHNRGRNYNRGGKRRSRAQQRTSSFRKRSEVCRTINLIDEYGNEQYIRKRGRLNITKHRNVLSALEMRALRYRRKLTEDDRDEALFGDALDETGTVSTAAFSDSESEVGGSDNNKNNNNNATEFERFRYEELTNVSDDLLTVHGVAPGTKPEGCSRLYHENIDGLRCKIMGNEKLDKAKEIIDELGADMVSLNELQLNLQHKANKHGLSELFNGGETDIRTVAADNVYENVSKVQQGGTGLLLYGPLIQQLQFDQSGAEDSGMGRWVVMTLQGEDGFRTRVVSAYNPCYNNKKDSGTSYQQQRRALITKFKDNTCPRKRFREDLVDQLTRWREQGDRLIVCMDANEDIYKKSIGKSLTDSEGLGMKEVVGDFTGKRLGATFFRGSTPIDAVWATSDVQVISACVMPVGYGVGDHRAFIIDFLTSSLIGTNPTTVVRPAARRLNTRLARGVDKYIDKVEDGLVHHKIFERIRDVNENTPNKELAQLKMDSIDRQRKDIMLAAEKRCRRISSGRIAFSPEASLWIRRCQVYRSLLKYKAGKITNRGNLKRAARRCKIFRPMHLTIYEIRERLKVAKEKCKHFRRHGKRYRRQHLNNCLQRAQDKNDEQAEKEILAIIEREKQRAWWRRQKYAFGKPRGGGVSLVQTVREDGSIVEHTSEEAIHREIFNEIHNKRFYLAEEAPICQGELRGEFGYQAFSPTANAILAGTYEYPDSFDEATREICEECAMIRHLITANAFSSDISRQRWQQRWKKAREETSSSESGLHFSHYKAGAESDIISLLHSVMTSVALRKGIALERWSRGLSVMLEKMFGCSLITKLRSILLMEADFNFANKEIFGIRMLDTVRKYKLMPEEIFSEKDRMPNDGGLAKVIFNDIVRQLRVPAALASVDASQCYDRIAHAIASLVFQAFGVPEGAIESMLTAIEEMKFFLRTAFGDSKTCAGSTLEVKFQGLCQGNGAAPAGFAVISITILQAHKRKGHGAHFKCPISDRSGHLAAILFVDDCDLLHLDMRTEQTVQEAHASMQASITNWGKLLMATGGALKPEKCFGYIISFEWDNQGRWSYQANEEYEEADFYVPQTDGSQAVIENLAVTECRETLGMFSSPSGNNEGAMNRMAVKAQEWVDQAKNGKVLRRSMWFMMDVQFWPRVGYGLCGNTASFEQLSNVLQKPYFNVLSTGGIVKTCKRGIRQLDRGFYGAGCPHPGVECLIEQTNKLLMHFGCRTSVGLFMQTSFELLMVELGISFQPINEAYTRYSNWVTHCWFRSLWEKISLFRLTIDIQNVPLKLPRVGDQWLMRVFIEAGIPQERLIRLNRVRVHQQVLFLSCVLGAGGKTLDEKYLSPRPEDQVWSMLRFPKEQPTAADFAIWKTALLQIAPGGSINDRLGKFLTEGPKLWDWRYDRCNNRLLHYNTDGTMDVYGRSTLPGQTRYQTRYSRNLTHQQREVTGDICTVVKIGSSTTVSLKSYAPSPRPPRLPETFFDVLAEWDSQWMWEDLRLYGDDDWLEKAIADDSLVAVTDGSYIKEQYPNLNSAAFIFECSKGRGRLIGSFPEKTKYANAYRGELLGLMAIHLILLSINRVNPTLTGSVQIYSDCLGALSRVDDLPAFRIPSRCRHSDILKNILVNCKELTFKLYFEHVDSHLDDHEELENLLRHQQLNVYCDYVAKKRIWDADPMNLPTQESFPLEPVCMFVEGEKVTSESGELIRFHAHRQLAQDFFFSYGIFDPQQFMEVAWDHVFRTLRDNVPRMFQVWACKQVMDIAGTFHNLKLRKSREDDKCPSCELCPETCAHVLECTDAGRVDALYKTVDLMDDWMKKAGTDDGLATALVRYAKGRGGITMEEICSTMHDKYQRIAQSQDRIGWRRFMEGMVSKEIVSIQWEYLVLSGSSMTVDRWMSGLIIKLLEVTHGQWLYRNIQVHDIVSGVEATLRKEEILMEIEKQQELGTEGLAEEDKYLMEINLDDLETTSGEKQEYWLLAIRAARMATTLSNNSERVAATATEDHNT